MRPLNRNDWLPGPHLLMIDEPQRSYKHISLWNGLVKFIGPGFGIYVVLFISYGALAGYGIPEPRDPFTFIQSNALGSSRSQTQIFLLSSLVKRKTTYLPAYAENGTTRLHSPLAIISIISRQALKALFNGLVSEKASVSWWMDIHTKDQESTHPHPHTIAYIDSIHLYTSIFKHVRRKHVSAFSV